MAKAREPDGTEETRVGLCARCAHAAPQTNARGSRFWRCLRAEHDPRYARYPAVPVQACPGFDPAPG